MKILKKKELNINLVKPKEAAYYGTAGYRLNTADLNNVLCRASVIAYIRSSTLAGKYIGLYITASHNPVEYNGIKIVDFNGNMLETSWEISGDELVNCEDKDFYPTINKIFRKNSNCTNMEDSIHGNVIIGHDTRESGEMLVKNIKEVLNGFRCNVFLYGTVSCPEMHYLVRKSNEVGNIIEKECYKRHINENYNKLLKIVGEDADIPVDTANGVGRMKIEELIDLNEHLKIRIVNNENGVLNKDCGADYVKTNKKIPKKIDIGKNELVASFDGDVDRLIFFTNEAHIYDGDAQAVFIALYLKKCLAKSGIKYSTGVILSMYSNRGAFECLRDNGFIVEFAQTGVKNFVRQAKKYDIGIYFEPNGHGSVIFSKSFLSSINELDSHEIDHVKILTNLFDPCIGDALANYIFFKCALKCSGGFIKYKEYCIRMMVVKIKDKKLLKVDEKCNVLEPHIQKPINQLLNFYKGKGFVRPSGTEDLVRIFAECAEQDQADELAVKIAQIIYDSCDGVGPHPVISYID